MSFYHFIILRRRKEGSLYQVLCEHTENVPQNLLPLKVNPAKDVRGVTVGKWLGCGHSVNLWQKKERKRKKHSHVDGLTKKKCQGKTFGPGTKRFQLICVRGAQGRDVPAAPIYRAAGSSWWWRLSPVSKCFPTISKLKVNFQYPRMMVLLLDCTAFGHPLITMILFRLALCQWTFQTLAE